MRPNARLKPCFILTATQEKTLRMDWTRIGILVFRATLLSSVPAMAMADDPPLLFASDDVLEASIEAPFDRINDERKEENEYEGVFRYTTADGQQQLNAKVRVRGHYRARKDVCGFAPLRLNFEKKQVKGTEFEGQDKLKLVTHCQNVGSRFEQLLLREYLVYRFLTAITENSLRTRLLKLTYTDSDGRAKDRTRYAFLLEGDDQVARRLNAKPGKVQSIKYDQLDQDQTNLLTVFEYFAGNTDFSAVRGAKDAYCCHNAILIEKIPGVYLPIPYDFDFSGIVDAPYAEPSPNMPIEKVTSRYYRGLCRNNDRLPATFDLFRKNREKLYQLVNDQVGLSDYNKAKMSRFIDGFYKTIDSESRVERAFILKCFDE